MLTIVEATLIILWGSAKATLDIDLDLVTRTHLVIVALVTHHLVSFHEVTVLATEDSAVAVGLDAEALAEVGLGVINAHMLLS